MKLTAKSKMSLTIARVLFAISLFSGNVACAADASAIAANEGAVGEISQQVPTDQGGVLQPGEERLKLVLERKADSGSVIGGLLVKNRYRQEPYQAEYDVQVPYQAEETYYVDIPYQTTETYYEDVPYTVRESYIDREEKCEQQYKCENRPRESCNYENICHTVPDRECRQERVCRPVPGEERCEHVEECGTNAHGERICKTRKVCHSGPSREDCDYVERCSNTSRQECRQERRCHTTNEQDCGYENVCHSVPVTRYRDVTKYRQEQRTREVTKYRQEARTRTVTKYRTEKQCCVTKYRDVLDHQDSLQVVLQLPPTSVLMGNEIEKFEISLIDQNGQLDVSMKMLSKITNYKVIDKAIQGTVATLTLEEIPVPVDVSGMGEKSLTGLRLKIMEDETAILVFKDAGQIGRSQTQYEIVVTDQTGAEEFRSTVVANGIADQKMTLDKKLSLKKVHTVTLTVLREGPGISPVISFVKTFKRPL